MSQLDEVLVQRVDSLGTSDFSGRTFRYTTASRDPLSGAGARLNGGRWNPADIFATVYLATPEAAVIGELDRAAAALGTSAEVMAPGRFRLHTVDVNALPVLDLRSAAARDEVGLTLDDIEDDDWTACQAVGEAAWFLGFSGLIAPSASGHGHVLAAFEVRTLGHVEAVESKDMTAQLIADLRGTAPK